MNRAIYLLSFFFFLFSQFLLGQSVSPIRVQVYPDGMIPGQQQDSLEDWILNNFHGGGGIIDTSTIKYIGNYQGFGRFWQGNSISFFCDTAHPGCMDEGLLISNGKVSNAAVYDPTNGHVSDVFQSPPNSQGDPDLKDMYDKLGAGPFEMKGDKAVIEFEYTPYGNSITMRYVYASEEYPNSLDKDDVDLTDGSQLYDLFGVFIDRVGTSGKRENRAILPLILDPPDSWVTLFNVNATNHSQFFTSNETGFPYRPIGFCFDAMTKPMESLKIHTTVEACKKYKIKIAIEDFIYPRSNEGQFAINSGLFLEKGSFSGGANAPSWTIDYQWTNPHHNIFDGKLIEGCNDLLITFTLAYPYNKPDYYIPFQILPETYKDKIHIVNEVTGQVIGNDTIYFPEGETSQTIRVSAVNLDADVSNVKFNYSINPCDKPPPYINPRVYKGNIKFDLINNEPFSFTVNPKEYSAYCKETIPLTLSDVTNGGVDPVVYIWPTNPTPPVDVYNYTVNASPDWVTVEVKDLCGNDTTTKIKINNKPIHLLYIPPLSFCKPGMQQDVTVKADPNFNDFPGYGFSNVDWLNLWYTPPKDLGAGNPKTIVYDDVIGEDVYFIKYNVTDVCGGKTTDTLKVDQTGKLDLGDDKYLCEGESVELINYTPVFNNNPNNYKWYIKTSPTDSTIIGTGNSIIVTPLDTTMYYLYIYDKCEQAQIDSLTVFVDHFKPQISIAPSTAEVCPGESVTLSANTANDYLWNPGGYTTQNITVTESTPGIYTYTLTASSDYCIDKETSASYQVFPSPEAVFALTPDQDACTGENIQFTYSSDTIGKEFDWDFGDGSTSILPNPVHAYGNEGLYTVNLHVQQYICDNDTSRVIEVNPLPAPDFSADVLQGCLPVEVLFQDQTADVAPGATYEWTFGDGNTSGQQNPANQYTTPGLFTVSLTVHNTARCAATSTKPNYIQANPNPVAKFEADPWITTLDTPDIDFSDLSTSDSTITGYEWDFGDGTTSTEENPTHTYTQAGEYEVILYVETVNGCVDTTIAKVALTEEVKLFMPNAFTPNGDGINDVFEIKGTPVSNFNLYIYDRWGKEIWSTHNFETQWDGTDFNGKPVPPGTYIYTISGTDYKKRDISFKGTVTVVK